MRFLRYILPVILFVFILGGCRSTHSVRKEGQIDTKQLVNILLADPSTQECTASLSMTINGTKVSGQIRMRRERSIQISASILGLMEVARVEFLPDMVVVMDRVHDLYSVFHYADIPYRNELGLSFEVVQALFWNKMFVPDVEDDIQIYLTLIYPDKNGGISFKESNYEYIFQTDGVSRLNAVQKDGTGFKFRIDYSDFSFPSKEWNYPQEMNIYIETSGTIIDVLCRMSSFSTDKKNWPDRTQVTRRMKQVSFEELLDKLNL